MNGSTRRKILRSALTGALLVGLATGTARAQALDQDDVQVTVVVPAGGVTLDAGADASISEVTQTIGGATTVSGALSSISVSDTRNLALGWATSVSVGDFTGPASATIPGTAATVTVAAADASQGLAAEGGFVGGTAAAGAGVIATAVAAGSNSATFTPSLSVVVPVDTAAGSYTGTVTFSVT